MEKYFMLILLLLIGLKEGQSQNNSRIVFGRGAFMGEIPYQVGLRVGRGNYFCTGSIIHESYVLTAAHCFQRVSDLNTIEVVAGDLFRRLPSFTRQINRIESRHIHPETSSNYENSDITILKLRSPFRMTTTVSTIPLARRTVQVRDGDSATIAGWGSINSIFNWNPEQLQVANVVFWDPTACKRQWGNDKLCTVRRGLNLSGACFGDSGGPVVSNSGNQRVLSGVMIRIISRCGNRNQPDIHTDVHNFYEWICQVTGQICN